MMNETPMGKRTGGYSVTGEGAKSAHCYWRSKGVDPYKYLPCFKCLRAIGYGIKRIRKTLPIGQGTASRMLKEIPTTIISRTKRIQAAQRLIWRGRPRPEPKEGLPKEAAWRIRGMIIESEKFFAAGKTREERRKEKQNKDEQLANLRPQHVIKGRLRSRLTKVLRFSKNRRKTWSFIGCDWPTLKAHIEAQFKQGMTWDNRNQWDIDHRIPCAAFDLEKPEEAERCFHFSNLQPLWRADNRRKSDWIEGAKRGRSIRE